MNMRMQKLISTGFATIALASAALPAPAHADWPDFDFEWYADVGKQRAVEETPAPRAGYIWSPGRYEVLAGRQVWVAGHWVKDDFADQVSKWSRR